MHKCTKSCRRFCRSVKSGRGAVKCRYGFPKQISPVSVINGLKNSVQSRKIGKKTVKLYSLARTIEETNINDYNP